MRLSSRLVVFDSPLLFSESEKGTAGFVDVVHGPRKDPCQEEWANPLLCWFFRPKSSLSERWLPFAKHGSAHRRLGMRCSHSWMGIAATTKSRWTLWMRTAFRTPIGNNYYTAFWFKECWCYLSTCYDCYFSWYDAWGSRQFKDRRIVFNTTEIPQWHSFLVQANHPSIEVHWDASWDDFTCEKIIVLEYVCGVWHATLWFRPSRWRSYPLHRSKCR